MLPCVTTWVGRGGCRVHGEHLSNCIGIEVRDGRTVGECRGCLPQPATHGVLCESCFERFEAALGLAVDLVTHMRSIERAAVPEGPRSPTKPGSQMIIPTSWLEADRTWSELHELAVWCDPLEFLQVDRRDTRPGGFGSRDSIEHVRGRVELAVDLAVHADITNAHTGRLIVRFYRAVQRALHMFPIEEYARPLPYARCRNCGHLTLERRAPLEYLDPITVLCINPDCQWEWDPHMIEVDLTEYRMKLEAESAEKVEGEAA